MSSRRAFIGLVALVASLTLSGAGRAETTFCTKITKLPATITVAGSYCLDRNLATTATDTANAVTVNADFVSLDLNGFRLDGTAAPPGSRSGVYASNRRNVSVRNGLIRGFERGVFLGGTGTRHLVEDLRVELSARAGIWVEGAHSVVRGCRVSGIVGVVGDTDSYGIRLLGSEARVLANDVLDTAGSGNGAGISILLEDAQASVLEGNRVGNASLLPGSAGIRLQGGQDILVIGNTFTTLDSGLAFVSETAGKYRDNLTSGVGAPFNGGTDAGNNQ